MASTRRLVAILAADAVGYSRLMRADEEGTHERFKLHRRELLDPKFQEHRGRIVKYTGDGMLVEFASVVDAVRCAAEIQRSMLDRNKGAIEREQIEFRMGINLGDVIVESEDIYGDGVNLAARLEALAEASGICVSQVVYEQVRDKLPYGFRDIGHVSVKNISRPLHAFALLPDAIAELPPPQITPAIGHNIPIATRAPRLSIVVLPFANLNANPDQQYLADAITDDLTTDLSRLSEMTVISRSTAFAYVGKPIDTRQIGQELKIRYVLQGSVRASGSRIRINAQLIDAETDTHVWADRFDYDANDLFALQDEVTARISVALDIELVGAEAARPAENPDALDYILRGRASVIRGETRECWIEAVMLFEKALRCDPASADAQAMLAAALIDRTLEQMTDTGPADIDRATELINQVLKVVPRHPLAHYARAQVLRAQRRHLEAIPEYETAISHNRNWVVAIAALGMCRFLAGSIEQAIPAQELAIRLSPRDSRLPNWYWRIGMVHLLEGRSDEAVMWLERARAANPQMPGPHAWLASAYGLQGSPERSSLSLAEARFLSGDGRYSSIARFKGGEFWSPRVRDLAEKTFLAGLRMAGVPES
ncbi:MAG: tetratricopeptide repeat protein [Alphaproteobacteria bacterium]|nr:tetratricopeptide repeat protein [Alphaproteobacteria bacterium]